MPIPPSYDFLFKLISVGDSGVGKSCLLFRLTKNEFAPTETTIGIEFGSSQTEINGKRIKLQIVAIANLVGYCWSRIISKYFP